MSYAYNEYVLFMKCMLTVKPVSTICAYVYGTEPDWVQYETILAY